MDDVPEWAPVLGVGLLTAPFWWSGLSKLLNFRAAIAETRQLGLRPAGLVAAVVILVQLGGSGLVISGYGVGIGAAALAVFTAAASLEAHAFWTAPRGPDRTRQLNAFMANVGLVGGLTLAVVIAGQPRP